MYEERTLLTARAAIIVLEQLCNIAQQRIGVARIWREQGHKMTRVLEVFLNDMRYINPRFTYLLTYYNLSRSPA